MNSQIKFITNLLSKSDFLYLNNFRKTFNKRLICNKCQYFSSSAENRLILHDKNTFPGRPTNGNILLAFSVTGMLEYFRSGGKEDKNLFDDLKKSQSYIENGDINEAAGILQDTLKQAQTLNDEDAIVQSKKLLADIALQRKEYAKAKLLIKEAIREILDTGVSTDHPKHIYMKLKLAQILEHCNEDSDAEKEYNECISAVEPKVHDAITNKDEETLKLWITILHQYSDFFHKKQNHDDALNYLKKAYDACSHLYGTVHEQAITLLGKLGKIHFLKGNLDHAHNLLKQAATIGENYPHSKDLSTVHTYLGNIHLKRGLLNEARNFCDRGLDTAMRHKSSKDIGEASVCIMNVINAMD